jgi:capsular polysaccharide biosynthesis protein
MVNYSVNIVVVVVVGLLILALSFVPTLFVMWDDYQRPVLFSTYPRIQH